MVRAFPAHRSKAANANCVSCDRASPSDPRPASSTRPHARSASPPAPPAPRSAHRAPLAPRPSARSPLPAPRLARRASPPPRPPHRPSATEWKGRRVCGRISLPTLESKGRKPPRSGGSNAGRLARPAFRRTFEAAPPHLTDASVARDAVRIGQALVRRRMALVRGAERPASRHGAGGCARRAKPAGPAIGIDGAAAPCNAHVRRRIRIGRAARARYRGAIRVHEALVIGARYGAAARERVARAKTPSVDSRVAVCVRGARAAVHVRTRDRARAARGRTHRARLAMDDAGTGEARFREDGAVDARVSDSAGSHETAGRVRALGARCVASRRVRAPRTDARHGAAARHEASDGYGD